MLRRPCALGVLAAALSMPALAAAIPQDPAFDVGKADASLERRGVSFLASGAVVGNRVVAVGSPGGGGILLYQFGRDGVPRGAVPFELGESAVTELAVFDRPARDFVVVGTTEGDLFVGRVNAAEPRTAYQTSLARQGDVEAVAAVTSGARDYVALNRRDGKPPEVWSLSNRGRPAPSFGSGGRVALSGLREITAMTLSPDRKTLAIGGLLPDFSTRVLVLHARTGASVRSEDIEDTSALRGIVWQGERLFGITGGGDGLQRLLELDPSTLEAGSARRLMVLGATTADEPGGGVTICGQTADGDAACRRLVAGKLTPLVSLQWGSTALPWGLGVGAAGSAVIVGRVGSEARLAVGTDVATSVALLDSRARALSARQLASALTRAPRSGRLPIGVEVPEVARGRVRLRLGRGILDVRAFRATARSATVTLRLDGRDRAAIARARRGSGRARLQLEVTVTDGAGNTAQDFVRAVLP